jgi:dienelactone hydrolase
MPATITRRNVTLDLSGASVPSIFLLPQSRQPVPAVLLLHGFSSSKERLASTMGRALGARGIASLAIDLPLHGDRDDALIDRARANPLALVKEWNKALAEAKAAIAWLASQKEINPRCVSIAGYSLGSYIAIQTAAAGSSVSSVILAAGGDLPETPWTNMVRMMSNPLKSAKSLKGKPLLMLNGKFDRTITPAQAERLFAAASEPKSMRWYRSGHVLPQEAADDAASWLAQLSNSK